MNLTKPEFPKVLESYTPTLTSGDLVNERKVVKNQNEYDLFVDQSNDKKRKVRVSEFTKEELAKLNLVEKTITRISPIWYAIIILALAFIGYLITR